MTHRYAIEVAPLKLIGLRHLSFTPWTIPARSLPENPSLLVESGGPGSVLSMFAPLQSPFVGEAMLSDHAGRSDLVERRPCTCPQKLSGVLKSRRQKNPSWFRMSCRSHTWTGCGTVAWASRGILLHPVRRFDFFSSISYSTRQWICMHCDLLDPHRLLGPALLIHLHRLQLRQRCKAIIPNDLAKHGVQPV